jgi:hypothetical protein
MSLSERLAEYEKPLIGGRCTVCNLLDQLPEGEAKSLAEALADPKFSNAGLSRILKAEGYPIGDSTIGRHRRSECLGR